MSHARNQAAVTDKQEEADAASYAQCIHALHIDGVVCGCGRGSVGGHGCCCLIRLIGGQLRGLRIVLIPSELTIFTFRAH